MKLKLPNKAFLILIAVGVMIGADFTNSGVTLTIDEGVTVTADGSFDNQADTLYVYGTLNITGDLSNSGVIVTGSNSAIVFNGIYQSIAGGSYSNVAISGGYGSKTLQGNVTLNGTLDLNSSYLDLNSYTLTVTGAINYNGGTITGSGDVLLNGNDVYDQDSTAPTITITSSESSPTKATTIPITVKFSETVFGFDSSDVTVTNDTLSSFSGSDTSYTFNLTPTAEGAVTVDIAANAAQDAAGNGNTAATQFSIIFDNGLNPTTIIASTAASPIKTAAIPISVSFSDKVTGFASSDLTVTNGSVTSLSGSGKTYSVTVTAAAQGLVTIIVPDNVAQDVAGYYNKASAQFNIVYSLKDNPYSLSFDGSNDYVKIPDSSALDFTGNFTIEAWVKVNGSDQSGQIMYRENPNPNRTVG